MDYSTIKNFRLLAMDEVASHDSGWHLFGRKVPKSEIVYFTQVILIYVICITAIVNLTLYKEDSKLWVGLLCSNIGYLLPNPTIKKNK